MLGGGVLWGPALHIKAWGLLLPKGLPVSALADVFIRPTWLWPRCVHSPTV